jgi:hypothetical protein
MKTKKLFVRVINKANRSKQSEKKTNLSFRVTYGTCVKHGPKWEKDAKELAEFMYHNTPSIYWSALLQRMKQLEGHE